MGILGALLAGGKARRFGRDKMLEPLSDGRPMVRHVYDVLAGYCDKVVICGRDWGDVQVLSDRPTSQLGPLGGLNAALAHAYAKGFDAVLCAPIDLLGLAHDFANPLIGEDAAVFKEQYLVGFWPSHYSSKLDDYVNGGDRAVHVWLQQANPRLVSDPPGLRNINYPSDL